MIFHLAKKDVLLFWTDKKALALSLLLPIGLITLFYYAFGGGGSASDQSEIEIACINSDSSEQSLALIEALNTSSAIKLIPRNDADAIKDLIEKGRLPYALFIHPGLTDSLESDNALPLEILHDAAQPMRVNILLSILMPGIQEYLGERKGQKMAIQQMMAMGMSQEQAKQLYQGFEQSQNEQEAASISVQAIQVDDDEKNFALIQALAGTAVMLLLFNVAGMAAGLLEEKEKGTLKRLLVSPFPAIHILGGKLLSTVVLACIQLSVLFIFAAIAFNLQLWSNLAATALMIIATAVVCSCLGIFLSSIAKSRKQVEMLSTIFILTMSALGGSMMPVIFMPEALQKIAQGTINYWSIQGFYDIYWRGLGITSIGDNIALLLLIGAILMGLSVPLFKKNVLDLI
jgi:ABC-type multidrug transport system permease subunit